MIDTAKFRVKPQKLTANYGKFELAPLFGGLGHTLGNALRRTLFITIPGAAITRIKIDGTSHLFSSLHGVKEDMVELSLNLKKVRFSYAGDEAYHLVLDKTGPGEVTAADISDDHICQVVTKDIHLATLADKKSRLHLDITVERGVGYTLAKEQKTDIVGEIILDSSFTPVTKVNYTVEPTRLGKKSNYDKLVFEIWTDGSVDPHQALKLAAKDVINSLKQIVDPKDFEDEVITLESHPAIGGAGDISIEEIELPLRVTNALKKAGYQNIDSLVRAGRTEVSRAKNVGEKSLKIIDSWLAEKSLTWK